MSRMVAFFLGERTDLVGKIQCLCKVLQGVCSFKAWNLAMFNNVPRWNLWL
jgi:hypothetical protein